MSVAFSATLRSYLSRISQWFFGLSYRERLLVSITAGALVIYISYDFVFLGVSNLLEERGRSIVIKERQLSEAQSQLATYRRLKQRYEQLQSTFAESQVSFEQITGDIDRIVKDAIGSDSYDLKRSRQETENTDKYQKQEYALKLRALSQGQLVKLLYQFEYGKSPVFVGQIDLKQSTEPGSIDATLELFSVRKAS